MASVAEAFDIDVDVDVGRRNSPDAEVDTEVDVDGIAGLCSKNLGAVGRMHRDQWQRWAEGAWASGVVVLRQAWVTCCGCWYDSDCDEERSKKPPY